MTFILTTLLVFAIFISLFLNWDWIETAAMVIGEEIESVRDYISFGETTAVIVGAASRVLLPTLVLSIIIAILVTL